MEPSNESRTSPVSGTREDREGIEGRDGVAMRQQLLVSSYRDDMRESETREHAAVCVVPLNNKKKRHRFL